MESALSPRDIQARLRGGETVAEVAKAAGVSESYIDAFAGPVLAEREHAVSLAGECQVRKRGELNSSRKLAETVNATLEANDVNLDDVHWDAWRGEDKAWFVQVSWPALQFSPQPLDGELDELAYDAPPQKGDNAVALFNFVLHGRYSVAANDNARVLIGDYELKPLALEEEELESEPTLDLHDEMALIRATQENGGVRPPAVLPDVEVDYEDPEDYVPAQFEQVNGVYDIVPNNDKDLDVLYDMLSGFNEDSVRIYTGLTRPPANDEDTEPILEEESVTDELEEAPEGAETKLETESSEEVRVVGEPERPIEKAAKPSNRKLRKPQTAKQDPLVEGEAPKKRKNRKRATVPSWDEIIFGAPKKED